MKSQMVKAFLGLVTLLCLLVPTHNAEAKKKWSACSTGCGSYTYPQYNYYPTYFGRGYAMPCGTCWSQWYRPTWNYMNSASTSNYSSTNGGYLTWYYHWWTRTTTWIYPDPPAPPPAPAPVVHCCVQPQVRYVAPVVSPCAVYTKVKCKFGKRRWKCKMKWKEVWYQGAGNGSCDAQVSAQREACAQGVSPTVIDQSQFQCGETTDLIN